VGDLRKAAAAALAESYLAFQAFQVAWCCVPSLTVVRPTPMQPSRRRTPTAQHCSPGKVVPEASQAAEKAALATPASQTALLISADRQVVSPESAEQPSPGVRAQREVASPAAQAHREFSVINTSQQAGSPMPAVQPALPPQHCVCPAPANAQSFSSQPTAHGVCAAHGHPTSAGGHSSSLRPPEHVRVSQQRGWPCPIDSPSQTFAQVTRAAHLLEGPWGAGTQAAVTEQGDPATEHCAQHSVGPSLRCTQRDPYQRQEPATADTQLCGGLYTDAQQPVECASQPSPPATLVCKNPAAAAWRQSSRCPSQPTVPVTQSCVEEEHSSEVTLSADDCLHPDQGGASRGERVFMHAADALESSVLAAGESTATVHAGDGTGAVAVSEGVLGACMQGEEGRDAPTCSRGLPDTRPLGRRHKSCERESPAAQAGGKVPFVDGFMPDDAVALADILPVPDGSAVCSHEINALSDDRVAQCMLPTPGTCGHSCPVKESTSVSAGTGGLPPSLAGR
jgi:hypothetical protein